MADEKPEVIFHLVPQTCGPKQAPNGQTMAGEKVFVEQLQVEVDLAKTSDIYADSHWDWCQCDSCENARMTRRHFFPPEQIELLERMGVQPFKPVLSGSIHPKKSDRANFVRYFSCWFFYGTKVEKAELPVLTFDRWNNLSITTRRPTEAWNSEADKYDRNDPVLLYLIAYNCLPKLHGQVCSFRGDYVATPCPDCGHQWRNTGYLKKRSLIPDWFAVPELNDTLRERKYRVFAVFCCGCGRFEYKKVPNKPPFRIKNNVLRDERKERRKYRTRRYHYYYLRDAGATT